MPMGESAQQIGQDRLQEFTISISARQVESTSMGLLPRPSTFFPSEPAASPAAVLHVPPPQQRFSCFPCASQ